MARVRIGAGTVNAHSVRGLLDAGWTGLEFLNLVPGTFGGAVALNAGTKEAELSERLVCVEWCRPVADEMAFERVDADALSMSYRDADVPDDAVVVCGDVVVEQGDVEAARQHMQQDRARRDDTQPYKLASWGSTFANPPGDYAGRLIDEVGLKGRQVGDAVISQDHANFLVNRGEATARDLLTLMALARHRVRDAYEIELRPEVRFVGFDGMAKLEAMEAELAEDDEDETSGPGSADSTSAMRSRFSR
jgi:UDP-N-acetylmuramate dehydrogenase